MVRKLLLFVLGFVLTIWAQVKTPLRDYRTTPHFELAVPHTSANDLPRLAAIAEAAYDSLSRFYDYRLADGERFRLAFLDEDDYANGFAIGFAGWVSVYTTAGDMALRGGPGWHANVISHEVAHLFSLRKLGFDSPYLGHMGGVSVSRDRGEAGLTFGALPADLESWLVEGLAQLGAEACGVDRWDALRDALEREAGAAGILPSLGALKTFHQDSRRAELLYNQGYGFLRWVHGSLDSAAWHALLADGREHGLQQAIATAMGADFPDLYSRWRAERDRHRASAAAMTSAWTAPHANDSVDYYRLQTRRVGSRAGMWYLDSRPNDQGILRLYSPYGEVSGDEPTGWLWSDATGTRVLFIATAQESSSLQINYLWEARAPGWTVQRIAGSQRVQAACYTNKNLWGIYHQGGRNRLGLFVKGHWQPVPGTPGALEPMELACPTAGPLVVSATFGAGRGLYAVGKQGDQVVWTTLTADANVDNRNPFISGDTLYYSSDRSGSFQIYRNIIAPGAASEMLTMERGGALYPAVWGDSLAYAALRGGNSVAVSLSNPVALAGRQTAPAQPAFVAPLTSLKAVPIENAKEPADRRSWLGWYTATQMHYGNKDMTDSSDGAGNLLDWSATVGNLWSDVTMRRNMEVQIGAMGSYNSKVFADIPGPLLSLFWSSETEPTAKALQTSVVALPMRAHGGDLADDEDWDSLGMGNHPWLVQAHALFQLQRSIATDLSWGVLLDYTLAVLADDQVNASDCIVGYSGMGAVLLAWQSIEPGVRHPNSGFVLQGGPGALMLGPVPALPVLTGVGDWYFNVGRTLYGNLDGKAIALILPQKQDTVDAGAYRSASMSLSLYVPLPGGRSALHPGHAASIAMTAWELKLAYGFAWTDSLLEGSMTPLGLRDRAQGMQPVERPLSRLSYEEVRDWGIWRQQVEASLRWEVLGFTQTRGIWELGARMPPTRPKDWSLFAQLVL